MDWDTWHWRKAQRALAILAAGRDGYGKEVARDGEWYRLGHAYNVGGTMLIWMVEHGLLERRHDRRGEGLAAYLNDWYRPTGGVVPR